MNPISLFDALTMIRDGKAAETLEKLQELRFQSSSDISANFVFAHALDVCGHHSRAQAVWETVNSLQAKENPTKTTIPPNDVPLFLHTDHFKAEIEKIFSQTGSDEIQDLITQLNDRGRKPVEDVVDTDHRMDEDNDDDHSNRTHQIPFSKISIHDDTSNEDYDGANTETYARILVTQKKYFEASKIYRLLSEENPEHKDRLLGEAQRLEELDNQQKDS